MKDPSEESTVLVGSLVDKTVLDDGESGGLPRDWTMEQYRLVYQQWRAGELTDGDVSNLCRSLRGGEEGRVKPEDT